MVRERPAGDLIEVAQAGGVKAATRGQWNEVWASFDKRQKANAKPAANEDAGDGESGDMFSRAGMAAEGAAWTSRNASV